MEIRDLSDNLYTKRKLICQYGQAVLTDKGLIFIDYYTGWKAKVKPEDLEIMKEEKGIIKYTPFTMSKMMKKKEIAVKRNIDRNFFSFTVPKDNKYTLDGKPMPKGVCVLLCNPVRIYTDKRTLITETTIVERPNYSKGMSSVTRPTNTQVSHNTQSATMPRQAEMPMKDVLEGADWKCVNVIMEITASGGAKKWGYTLQHLGDGDMQQVNLTTVMSLAKKGEISNMKLVESKNGEPFLQGINGLKLENLKQIRKQ